MYTLTWRQARVLRWGMCLLPQTRVFPPDKHGQILTFELQLGSIPV